MLAIMVSMVACAPDPPSAIVGVHANGCGNRSTSGSGAIVANGLVLTSAHTLRGADEISVTRGDDTATATVVAFDPDLDLAYLRTDLSARALTIDSDGVRPGDHGDVWVVRDGQAMPLEATVVRRINLRTEDIYVEGVTERPGLELAADIRPGDSGGVVVVNGNVVGVVWARSREQSGRAYAIDPDRGGDRIAAQRASGDLSDVDLARCN